MHSAENKTNTDGSAESFGNVYFKNLLEKHDVLVTSPFSAQTILLIAFFGSAGATEDAFVEVLKMEDSLCEECSRLLTDFSEIKSVTFLAASKMFVKKGFSVVPEYKQLIFSKFSAEIEELSFDDNVETARAINAWIDKKTNSKIHEIIKPDNIDGNSILFLTNAVYFKGSWAKPFDPRDTKQAEFHLSNGTTKPVQMMHQHRTFHHARIPDLKAKILELYYEGGDFSMIIILPDEIDGIAQLKRDITDHDLTDFQTNEVSLVIAIPKFKIETEMELEEVFGKMGLEILFTDRADFSGISQTEGLKVSKILQKAFVEVNEEGTEAAAATGMEMMTRSMPMTFTADHEFIFAIKYKDVILFQGLYS